MRELQQEYKEHLETLNKVELNIFLNEVRGFKENKETNYFRDIEKYLNENINKEILDILKREEYLKLFYVDSQAQYILKELNLNKDDLDFLKTLVYCYNSVSKEFKEKLDLKILETNLFNRGFIKQKIVEVINDKVIDYNEDLKKLNGLKVICVMDISKIGIMGSFDKKEELEGTLTYSDYHNGLMLIPKRCRTRGHIIRTNFYYKIIGKGV